MRAVEKKTKQENFLKAYADCCSVRRACQMAGVARSTVYNWQETDSAFAQQFAEASEDANDFIDDEIVRRAVHGYQEPVVSNGKLIYGDDGRPLTVTKYSDTLMQMLAKSRMTKYREKQQIDLNAQITTLADQAKDELLADLSAMIASEKTQTNDHEE